VYSRLDAWYWRITIPVAEVEARAHWKLHSATPASKRLGRNLPRTNRKQAERSTLDNGKLKVRYKVHVFQHQRRAQLVEGEAPPERETLSEPQGTVPRIARLLALAHHIQELVDTGQVRDLAEVARRGHISRARMTQIMNLLLLAPDIQEKILFLPETTQGSDSLTERHLRQVLGELSFENQRRIWRGLARNNMERD